MEKRTLLFVIVGIVVFAFAFILLAVLVSQMKSKKDKFYLPEFLNSSSCPEDFSPLPLVLISLDGFRPDYLDRGVTPTLKMLAEKGASAPYMSSSFPSITFPNHYTIVTGLYPESHGIIQNAFFDPVFNETFSYSRGPSNQGRWWGGDPIWNVVQKHGMKSGIYFWPGSEADIGGMQPNYWFKYSSKVPLSERMQKVLEWLTYTSSERPSFISLYSHEPDKIAHEKGPDSSEVTKQLFEVDTLVQNFLRGLAEKNILQCVNIIIISDHGMASGGPHKIINLDQHIGNFADKIYFTGGATAMVSLKKKYNDTAKDLEKALSCKLKDMRAFKKTEMPLRLHFSNNRRIHDYILRADEGYVINLKDPHYFLHGIHGFDNHVKSMNSLFIAYGPSIKPGVTIEPFQNIELYNLLCTMLEVPPSPNNGTQGLLYKILQTHPPYPELKVQEAPPYMLMPNLTEVLLSAKASQCDTEVKEIQSLIDLLNRTQEEGNSSERVHLPWGAPHHQHTDLLSIKLLFHPDHITGYSTSLKRPLWTSFSIDEEATGGSEVHWTTDARLLPDNNISCPEVTNHFGLGRNFKALPLFMPAFVSDPSLHRLPSLLSNAVPFNIDLIPKWTELILDTIPRRVKYSKSPLNVILGPVFDHDSNGLDDNSDMKSQSAVPSDYFAVVSRCRTRVKTLNDCSEDNLDAIGFVLPQFMAINNCLSSEEFALDYSARIRDIEQVSGLQFYTTVESEHRLRLILREKQELWPLTS